MHGFPPNDFNLDICYQGHNLEFQTKLPKDFSRHSLFIKKLVTIKMYDKE